MGLRQVQPKQNGTSSSYSFLRLLFVVAVVTVTLYFGVSNEFRAAEGDENERMSCEYLPEIGAETKWSIETDPSFSLANVCGSCSFILVLDSYLSFPNCPPHYHPSL